MITTIDGALFAKMVIHGSACINAQKQQINELNVFPVPDGDTGTNMSMTIGTAAEELKKKSHAGVGDAAMATANALLRGARGNSGVILSLLFRGFAKAVKEKERTPPWPPQTPSSGGPGATPASSSPSSSGALPRP